MRTAGERLATPAPAPAPASVPDGRSDPASGLRKRVTEVVNRHTDIVFRTLRRLGVPAADADDGVQQVFVTFARRISELRPGVERAFVLGTAVRVAHDYHRKRRRRKDELSPTAELDVSDEGARSPEALLDRKRGLELLDAVLARLPEEQRAVFVLFEIEGLRTAEIAALLSIPQGTVSSRLHRARATFEAICAKRERLR